MLANRLPLLWAFAGGCLGSAALFSFSRAAETAPSPTKQGVLARTAEDFAPPIATTGAVRDDATGVEPSPSSSKDSDDIGGGSPTEPGSSVADLLIRLETAYRQGLAAAVPGPPQAATTATEAPPPEAPAHEVTAVAVAVAVAATTPPPKSAAQAEVHPAPAPQAVAGPVLASRDDARPRDVHVGDIHQNTNVGNVHHGDVVQTQELAIIQYIQLLALSPHTQLTSPTHRPRGVTTRRAPFSTSLTNPDNPWGFNFPPTVLVK